MKPDSSLFCDFRLMVLKGGAFACALLFAGAALAETVTFSSMPPIYNAATKVGGIEYRSDMLLMATNWSDQLPPTSGKDYVLDPGSPGSENVYLFGIGGSDVVFNGKSLTLKGSASDALTISEKNSTVTFANDGLIFAGGGFGVKSTTSPGHVNAANFTIKGKVNYTDDTVIQMLRKTSLCTFAGPKISASSGKTVTITSPGSAASGAIGLLAYHTRLLGDMSEFAGTLRVGGNSACLGLALLCTDDFAGTVQVTGDNNSGYYGSGTFGPCSTNATGAITDFGGETKVAKLTVKDNGNLVFGISLADPLKRGRITVRNTFTADGRVNVILSGGIGFNYVAEDVWFPLVTAPKGSDLANVNFIVRTTDPTGATAFCTDREVIQNYTTFTVRTDDAANTETYGFWLHPYVKCNGVVAYGSCVTNASGTVVHYGGDLNLSSLALKDGDNLALGVDLPNGESSAAKMGTITVTDSFSAAGRVNLYLAGDLGKTYSMADEIWIPLVTAPKGTGLAQVDFHPIVRTANGASSSSDQDLILRVSDFCVRTNDQANTETYGLVVPKFSKHTTATEGWGSGQGLTTQPANFQRFWYWDYATDNITALRKDTVYWAKQGVYFQGALTIRGFVFTSAQICGYTSNWTGIGNIRTSGSSCLYQQGSMQVGNVDVQGTTAVKMNTSNKDKSSKITMKGRLTGDGTVTFTCTNNVTVTTSDSACDMTGFSGKFDFAECYSGTSKQGEGTVYSFGDATKLGTPTNGAPFAYNAVHLVYYARLKATGNVDATYANRGLYVSGNGGIEVDSGKTFSHAGAMTLVGTCTKFGTGLFALGGTMRFSTGQSTTPTAGKNIFSVTAGSIAALSTNAFNGAAITFAAGTELVVDAGSSDEGLLAYGLVDTKTTTSNTEPFTAAAGKIAVRFRATGDTGKMPKTVAVCTVKSTSAYADPTKYEFANDKSRVGHLRFNGFAARDNGDSTTTVYANFTRSGLAVILK